MEKLLFKLQAFEGPLDLLMHLISKNKVNIYDIPISVISEQFMDYIHSMKELDLEVTADFVAMASQLLLIKSKMLLPSHSEEEEDPRDELVRLILEYKRYKEAARVFSDISSLYYNSFVKGPEFVQLDNTYSFPHSLNELFEAYKSDVKKLKRSLPPPVSSFKGIVGRTIVTVTSKVFFVLRKLLKKGSVSFISVFDGSKSRSDIVATFLAVLELARAKRINLKETKKGEINISLVNGDK